METAITSFQGEHRWLSNFWPCPVHYDGLTYQSSEAAYQAAKALDPLRRPLFTTMAPGRAKREGNAQRIRPDWNKVRDQVMLEIVRAKFAQNPGLADKLRLTGKTELIEGNSWGDTYWGICRGIGLNKLGKILMQVREEITP